MPTRSTCGVFHSLLAVALVGLTGSAVAAEPAATPRADLEVLREDCAFFATIELGEHWRGPEKEHLKLLVATHPVVLIYHLAEIETLSGITAAQVDRLVFAFEPGEDGLFLLTLNDPKQVEPFLTKLIVAGTKKTVGSWTFWINPDATKAACPLDERTIALGKTQWLERLVGDNAKPSENMPSLFDKDPAQYPRGSQAKPFMADGIREARAGLAKAAVRVAGPAVEARVNINTKQPITTTVMLLTLGPRPKR